MSDIFNVIYSPQAKDDLRSIYSYIAFDLQAPDTAKNQVSRIQKVIRSLDFMPERYSIVDWEPWQSMQMHKLPVDNFVVYYIVDSNTLTVTIVRIVYGGLDIQNVMKTES